MSIVEVPRPRDSDVARRIETDGESFAILYFNTQQSLFANRQFSRFLFSAAASGLRLTPCQTVNGYRRSCSLSGFAFSSYSYSAERYSYSKPLKTQDLKAARPLPAYGHDS